MNDNDQTFLELTRRDPATGELVAIPARERIDRIVSHPFAREIVRSMDAQSLYDLIQEAGIDDASDLVLMASAPQVQSFLDLSCWRRDEFDLDEFTDWIDLLLQSDDREFAELLHTMDREALTIWIREQVAIFEWEQDRDLLDTISDPVSSSPDGVYAFVFPEDERAGAQIRLLLERVYAYDLEFALHLLEGVRWELTTDMMEHMYRMRNARLSDLGFVPFEEAIEVYAWLEPNQWLRTAREALKGPIAPATSASTAGQLPPVDYQLQSIEQRLHSDTGNTFAQAFARIGQLVARDEVGLQADRVLSQFRAVANRVHIADLGGSSYQNVARKAVERTQNHLSIALELLAPDDAELQAKALLVLPLKDLHRAGYSTVAALARQAQQLTARGNLTLVETSPYSLLSSEDEEMMRGLASTRPVMHRGRGTPFQSLRDVQRVAGRLGVIAFAELLFFAWLALDAETLKRGEGVANGAESITLRTLFATLILGSLVPDRAASLEALDEATVRAVLAELHASEDLFGRLLARAHEVVTDLSPDAEDLAVFGRSFVDEYATALAVTLEQLGEAPTNAQITALVLHSVAEGL